MKKLIPIFCVLALLLCACTQKENPPHQNTDTEFSAVYEAGDFRFRCHIKWSHGTAYVTVEDTGAAGLTLSCDGQQVTFSKGAMLHREPKETIDPSNPALLLWEIFAALESGGSQCALGSFDIRYLDSGEIERITVADIVITNSRAE